MLLLDEFAQAVRHNARLVFRTGEFGGVGIDVHFAAAFCRVGQAQVQMDARAGAFLFGQGGAFFWSAELELRGVIEPDAAHLRLH